MGVINRIVFLGNNTLAVRVLEYLKTRPQELVGLVLHPRGKVKQRKKLLELAELPKSKIFRGDKINSTEIIKQVKALKPDLLVSVMFGYILKKDILKLPKYGAVNLHPAYLPFNRGAHPNVWSIVKETPAGVTLHTINEGTDTGLILAQKQVASKMTDTGKSLYKRLEEAAYQLFIENWPKLVKGKLKPKSQPLKGTFHKVKDLKTIDEIKLNRVYQARELINILRARTFPPYKGVYFIHNKRKVYLRLQLSEAKD